MQRTGARRITASIRCGPLGTSEGSCVQTEYEQILRELQKSRVDGEEFIRLRRQIEALRPLLERLALLRRLEKEQDNQRRTLLAEWEDIKAAEFRTFDQAARNVSDRAPQPTYKWT